MVLTHLILFKFLGGASVAGAPSVPAPTTTAGTGFLGLPSSRRRRGITYWVEIDGERRSFRTEREAQLWLSRREAIIARRVRAQIEAREKRQASEAVELSRERSTPRRYQHIPDPEIPAIVVSGGEALARMAADINRRIQRMLDDDAEIQDAIAQDDEDLMALL